MTNQATTFEAARAENYAQVVLDTTHYAEAITQYPKGVVANAVAIAAAIVHMDQEGDQPVDTREGSQVVRWCDVSIPQPGATVIVAERGQQRDTFLIRGEIWGAEKIVRRTPYRVRVRCKRTEGVSTKVSGRR